MGILYDRSYGFSLITDGVLVEGNRYDIKYNQDNKKCEVTDDNGVKHIYSSDCFRFENYYKSRSEKWKSITVGEDGIRRDGYGNVLRDNLICPWCGTKFNQTNKNQKYCCYECSLKYQRKHYKRDDDKQKTKNNDELEEFAKMCSERGMTYGQYISREILNVCAGGDYGTDN